MVVHICLKLQFQRYSALFMTSKAVQYTDVQSSKVFVVKKSKSRNVKKTTKKLGTFANYHLRFPVILWECNIIERSHGFSMR